MALELSCLQCLMVAGHSSRLSIATQARHYWVPTMTFRSAPWSIAIFAARETPEVLARCVKAAIKACTGRQAVINVLINGNAGLADAFAIVATDLDHADARLRVWSIAAPDKAHTWNEYVYQIWEGNSTAFFIDGYAQVRPDALEALESCIAATPDALGATGVPTCGRSAAAIRAQMLRDGGIHGNLFAISAEGMQGIRKADFKLPLGIYRTDPLIGAVLMFRLDPANHSWNPRRIAVAPDATWHVDGIEDINLKNLKSQFKRILRQAQGDLESKASREHLAVRRLSPQQLPLTVADMVGRWIKAQPAQARSLFLKRPLSLYAARKLAAPRDWSATAIAPRLVLDNKANAAA